MEVGEEGGRPYLSLHCHHHSESCIQLGSDESHFNVSLIVVDGVTTETVFTNHEPFRLKRKDQSRSGIEPRPFCLPA